MSSNKATLPEIIFIVIYNTILYAAGIFIICGLVCHMYGMEFFNIFGHEFKSEIDKILFWCSYVFVIILHNHIHTKYIEIK